MPALKSSIVGETFDKVVRKAEFEGISFVDFLNLPDMPKEAPPARSDAAFASHHGHRSPCVHAGIAGVHTSLSLLLEPRQNSETDDFDDVVGRISVVNRHIRVLGMLDRRRQRDFRYGGAPFYKCFLDLHHPCLLCESSHSARREKETQADDGMSCHRAGRHWRH